MHFGSKGLSWLCAMIHVCLSLSFFLSKQTTAAYDLNVQVCDRLYNMSCPRLLKCQFRQHIGQYFDLCFFFSEHVNHIFFYTYMDCCVLSAFCPFLSILRPDLRVFFMYKYVISHLSACPEHTTFLLFSERYIFMNSKQVGADICYWLYLHISVIPQLPPDVSESKSTVFFSLLLSFPFKNGTCFHFHQQLRPFAHDGQSFEMSVQYLAMPHSLKPGNVTWHVRPRAFVCLAAVPWRRDVNPLITDHAKNV